MRLECGGLASVTQVSARAALRARRSGWQRPSRQVSPIACVGSPRSSACWPPPNGSLRREAPAPGFAPRLRDAPDLPAIRTAEIHHVIRAAGDRDACLPACLTGRYRYPLSSPVRLGTNGPHARGGERFAGHGAPGGGAFDRADTSGLSYRHTRRHGCSKQHSAHLTKPERSSMCMAGIQTSRRGGAVYRRRRRPAAG
jgi:hypothetical protein